MNVGELSDIINILSVEQVGNVYSWKELNSIFSKVKKSNSRNLYSFFGIGAKSIEFTIRKLEYENLTQHNSINWNGLHCVITDIIESDDKEYYVISAALVEPKTCTIKHTSKPTYNNLNNPVYSEPTIITFPAYITEKYVKYTQGQPMTTIESSIILITPKVISLNKGEIVTFNNKEYEVILDHVLDEYRNEYEILQRGNT